MMQPDSEPRIAALLLAAGSARRFGSNKLLEEYAGKPLMLHAAELAQACFPGDVTLVTGHDAERIAAATDRFVDRVVHNPAHADGIGTSLAAGIRKAGRGRDAMILLLADQPLVTKEHIQALVNAWSSHQFDAVVTAGTHAAGPPTLFDRRLFPRLAELEGDKGAREVLTEPGLQVCTIEDSSAFFDVDTRDDLAALKMRRQPE